MAKEQTLAANSYSKDQKHYDIVISPRILRKRADRPSWASQLVGSRIGG